MANILGAAPFFKPGRWRVWALYALVLTAAPLVFSSSLALSLLSQAGCLVIVCLSYNVLLGQGGMLSFGHAVYAGLGAFFAIHAMRLAAQGALPMALPLPLVPLVGGLAGLVFAALLGYAATRKAGTTFAMITLGMGELVFAMAQMFPGFFGGEAGISANRAYGPPVWGITFGPQRQVYYLIAAYCFICTAAMFALTRTPLGRLLNAVRDNPGRVEFIGYDARRVRYQAFMLAGFFAGMGGALAAINSEIVTIEALGSTRSASVLLFTFLGGAGFFAGPILGAALMVLALFLLSELTRAWLLYVGLLFLVMVMYAPGGLASLVAMNLRVAAFGKFKRLVAVYLALALAALAPLAGAGAMIEMAYQLQLRAALGSELAFMGLTLDASQPGAWLGAGAVLVAGLGLFELARRSFCRQWRCVQNEIDSDIRHREKAPSLLSK
ncbi:MAG: branched-chain amino acid ABC transporter permease [Polaromonas sp.]